jgi:hypothetical protein
MGVDSGRETSEFLNENRFYYALSLLEKKVLSSIFETGTVNLVALAIRRVEIEKKGG